jgi:hypothetical protein
MILLGSDAPPGRQQIRNRDPIKQEALSFKQSLRWLRVFAVG